MGVLEASLAEYLFNKLTLGYRGNTASFPIDRDWGKEVMTSCGHQCWAYIVIHPDVISTSVVPFLAIKQHGTKKNTSSGLKNKLWMEVKFVILNIK